MEFEKKQNGGGEERGIAKKLVAMAQVCEKETKETGIRGSKEKPSDMEDKIVGIKKTETHTKKTALEGKKRSEGYLVSAEDAPVYNLEVFVTHFLFLGLKCFILSPTQNMEKNMKRTALLRKFCIKPMKILIRSNIFHGLNSYNLDEPVENLTKAGRFDRKKVSASV